MDLSVSARLPRQVFLSGGTSTGRERTNDCAFLNQPNLSVGLITNGIGGTVSGFAGSAAGISSPNLPAFCDVRPPLQTYVKFLAVYPLPWWGLQTSATIQSLPGVANNPSYVATNALIAPSLGRNLAAGANGTVLVDLAPPNTNFTARINQTNLRIEKRIPMGHSKLKAMVDFFNMFNQNPVLGMNTRYGSSYLVPTLIEPARLVKFSAQWDF
jgi:hypothetical protein